MRTYQEIEANARKERPFSNGTEWEIWRHDVCHGKEVDAHRCVLDDHADEPGGCPLILASLSELTPAEWSGPHGRYQCSEKATAADLRRRERAEQRRCVEQAHYPMFDTGGEG